MEGGTSGEVLADEMTVGIRVQLNLFADYAAPGQWRGRELPLLMPEIVSDSDPFCQSSG